MIIQVASDTRELEGAFDHAKRGIPVSVHDSVGERTVIRADPHRDTAVPAESNQWSKPFPNALQFGGILLVSVFNDFELL